MNKKLEAIFDKQLEPLSEKEKSFFYGIKTKSEKIWKTLKPIALALAMFYVFGKIYKTVGHDYTIFILLVIVVILLRNLSSKLGEMLG